MIGRMRKLTPHVARVGALALFAALGLGGCSGSFSPSSLKNETADIGQSGAVTQSEQAAAPAPSARPYFEALASNDPVVMTQAEELSVPDSDAQAYAVYLAGTVQADQDSGYDTAPRQVKKIKGGFAMCGDSTDQGTSCSEYTNMVHQDDLVETFDAGGSPLSGRISLGDGEVKLLGDSGQVSLVAAYHSIAGDVVAVFEVESSPGGRLYQADSGIGPTALDEGESAYYTFYFKDSKFGGEVTISALAGDGYEAASAAFATQ